MEPRGPGSRGLWMNGLKGESDEPLARHEDDST